jgi:hypothetical protein
MQSNRPTRSTRPTKRTTRWNSTEIGCVVLVIAVIVALASAGTAIALDRDARSQRDRGREHSADARRDAHTSGIREAKRVDRHLARRGHRINHHYDVLAFVAAIAGDIQLAVALDRRGDRIERRHDRRGDRRVHGALAASVHRHARGCRHSLASSRAAHAIHERTHWHESGARHHRRGHRRH